MVGGRRASSQPLDDETEDTGYGDMLYDDSNDRYVAILYHGTQTEASLKQYTFRITKGSDVEQDAAPD